MNNEQLIDIIRAGNEDAYRQLFRNLRPIILHETAKYIGLMESYAREDLIQECEIVAWEIISRGNFKGGNFNAYFAAAIRNRLIRIWQDFNRKNLICLGEVIDEHWGVTRIMVESDYAREYREKQRQRSKAWYEKKKAAQPQKEKKPRMTKEEKTARQVAWQREYYASHPDKLAERREKNRIRERERREAKKMLLTP
jgi:hypothetical protein